MFTNEQRNEERKKGSRLLKHATTEELKVAYGKLNTKRMEDIQDKYIERMEKRKADILKFKTDHPSLVDQVDERKALKLQEKVRAGKPTEPMSPFDHFLHSKKTLDSETIVGKKKKQLRRQYEALKTKKKLNG